VKLSFLCKRNIPIAEIRPIHPQKEHKRPLGLAKGDFEVGPEFFEPLPERDACRLQWKRYMKNTPGYLRISLDNYR